MRYLQAAAGVVSSLTVATLIVFWTVKGTKPSGDAVLPILYGAVAASGLTWSAAELWKRSSNAHASETARPEASVQTPQAVHVLPTSHYTAGKLAAEAGMTPLERWLKGRIEEAGRHRHERTVLGTSAWQRAMNDWEVQNVTELAADYPSLVPGYRGDPPGHRPGLENEEAFYERQLGWLKVTLQRLSAGAEAVEPAPARVDLLREQYRKGRTLQRRLVVAAGTAETPEQAREIQDEARNAACKWGEGVWRVIAEHFSGYERDFFGDGHLALGGTGFALACQQEIERLGGSADSFLERKLDFVAELLKRYDR